MVFFDINIVWKLYFFGSLFFLERPEFWFRFTRTDKCNPHANGVVYFRVPKKAFRATFGLYSGFPFLKNKTKFLFKTDFNRAAAQRRTMTAIAITTRRQCDTIYNVVITRCCRGVHARPKGKRIKPNVIGHLDAENNSKPSAYNNLMK